MNEFYLLPHAALVSCVMLLGITVTIQTVGITYSCRRLQREGMAMLENVTEIVVLLHLLVLATLMAAVAYHSTNGYVYPGRHFAVRYMVFLLLSGLSVMLSWKKHMFWPLVILMGGAMTLPVVEIMSGRAFPYLFMAILVFWFLRCLHIFLLRRREQQEQLSALSIKEAVDTLDSGVLFYLPDGQILLQNNRMQELILIMTGKFIYNGKAFYESLQRGQVLSSCTKGDMGEQLTYWLPDGSVWVFDLYPLHTKKQPCLLLTASNNTQRWTATHLLWKQNQELEKRNKELQQVLENLESICRTEETIRAKSRVHDVLGQRISLLLRALREHREPDEVLLASFADGLPKELTEVSANPRTLDTLVDVFRGLGVAVRVTGELPPQEPLASVLSEIAAEAVTNAVRHGYASEVDIQFADRRSDWCMEITDSGLPAEMPVTEGGGLQEMRRKAERLGGTFAYHTTPRFCISVKIPKGETT